MAGDPVASSKSRAIASGLNWPTFALGESGVAAHERVETGVTAHGSFDAKAWRLTPALREAEQAFGSTSAHPRRGATDSRQHRQAAGAARHETGTMSESSRLYFTTRESLTMATNNPRHGYERKRSQLKTKAMGQKHGTKRSRKTGEFMDQKKVGKFKSVRREKST